MHFWVNCERQLRFIQAFQENTVKEKQEQILKRLFNSLKHINGFSAVVILTFAELQLTYKHKVVRNYNKLVGEQGSGMKTPYCLWMKLWQQ